MFGYITINPQNLPQERQARFRAHYCGLCRTLRRRFGLAGNATLSYDMTFLAMLLNALYEPGETSGRERCFAHPLKAHDDVTHAAMEYAADMNLALAYHKCLDNWRDDHSVVSAAEARLLSAGYEGVRARHAAKCEAIEHWLSVIHEIESGDLNDSVDAAVNATGKMMGELFLWREDSAWSGPLRAVGDGLGRFIYFMDAYEDLPADLRRRRFNPLKPLRKADNYEALCRSAMLQMMADATEGFELLPIVLDADILRNVLYSGVWCRYGAIQRKRNPMDKGEN